MIIEMEVDLGWLGVIPAVVWANYSDEPNAGGWEVERVLCLINDKEVDIWPEMLTRERLVIVDALEEARKEGL